MGVERRYMVYGIGNGIVDRQVRLSDDELQSLGLSKGRMELTDAGEQAGILAHLGDREGELHAGGSAANTIAGIAQMGGKVAYACSLAEDDAGQHYRSDFAQLGIHLTGSSKADDTTGLCLVLVTPDGERTMKTCLGASALLCPDDVDEATVAASEWVYLEGYLLAGDATRAASFHAMDLAKRHDTRIAISFSDRFVVEAFGADLKTIVSSYADLVFANESEAESYTGVADPQASLAALLNDCAAACVTCSERGSYVHLNGEQHYVPAQATRAVDMTGAGDIYAAGVLYGISSGAAPERAARLGARVAYDVVRQMGARLEGDLTGIAAEILSGS